jgi:hypothetical protein
MLQAAAAEGLDPPALRNRPTLFPGVAIYWQCFSDLTGDRQAGWGVGPIPWLAIDRWAAREGIDDPDDFALLVHLVRVIDGEWLAVKAKQAKTTEGGP